MNRTTKRYEVRVASATFHQTYPKTYVGTLVVACDGESAAVVKARIDRIDLNEKFPGLADPIISAAGKQAIEAVEKLQTDPRWPITYDPETGIETHIVGQVA